MFEAEGGYVVSYFSIREDRRWDDLLRPKGLARIDEGGKNLPAFFAFRYATRKVSESAIDSIRSRSNAIREL